jgi:hypothetical protein
VDALPDERVGHGGESMGQERRKLAPRHRRARPARGTERSRAVGPCAAGTRPGTLDQVKQVDSQHAGRPHPDGAVVLEPWFRRRPVLTFAVATALYAGVLGLKWLISGPEPILLLFCFPIALLAIAFGLRAGLLAGVGGIALTAIATALDGFEPSLWGWVARVTPMLLLGGLLGHAADQLRHSEAERNRLMTVAQRHRDAVDFNDRIVQELAAAKWALEGGNSDRGLDILGQTLDTAQHMVSQMLRDADAESGDAARRSGTFR